MNQLPKEHNTKSQTTSAIFSKDSKRWRKFRILGEKTNLMCFNEEGIYCSGTRCAARILNSNTSIDLKYKTIMFVCTKILWPRHIYAFCLKNAVAEKPRNTSKSRFQLQIGKVTIYALDSILISFSTI